MRLLTILLITIMSNFLLAQVDSYDINTFKTPDYNFQLLRFDPSFNFDSGDLSSDKILNYGLDSQFYLEKNTRKRISTLGASVDYFVNRIDDGDEETPGKFSSAFLRVYSTNQFFFKPKRFIELKGSASVARTGPSQAEDITVTAKFSPKIGFGRIENITNAWHTQSILKALKKEGLLLRDLSHDEIAALAKEMTLIKNKRVIDFRLDDIYEYESILSHLFDEGIADPQNYKFFSVFQDAWRFEAFRTRRQGSTLTVGTNSEFREFSIYKSHHHSLEVEYNAYHNKENWSFRYGGGIEYGKQFFSSTASNNNLDIVTATVGIGNYLNSRTFVELLASCRISDSFDNTTLDVKSTVEYFVSPRLKFSGSLEYHSFGNYANDYNQLKVGFGAEYIVL